MNVPLVSVLMVAYNSAKFIKEAIESVLNQSYAHFELIVCDDNSPDNSWEIISSFSDQHIRKYRNKKNLGEYQNRNYAISHANGEYLIFIDADDIMYPHGLQFMMRYAVQSPDCVMIISRPWDERIIYPKRISPHDFYAFEFLDSGISGLNFTKILFKSAAFQSKKPFPDNVKLGDMYIQFLLASKDYSVVIPDASTWWRRNQGQASEKLLNDVSLNLMHSLWVKLEMLESPVCPLLPYERNMAFQNVYGEYLRILLKLFLRLKFRKLNILFHTYPVPVKYMSSIFRKQKRSYFIAYNGNSPFKDH